MNKNSFTLNDKKRERYISALLILHNINQAELARKLGVSKALVSVVVSGRRKGVKKQGKRVKQAVADALGMKIEDLWPNRAA